MIVLLSVVSVALRTLTRSSFQRVRLHTSNITGKSRLTAFCARFCHSHLDGPALPADLIIAPHIEPRLPTALLKELDGDLSTAVTIVRRRAGMGMWLAALCLELAYESGDTLLDQGVDLILGDIGEL